VTSHASSRILLAAVPGRQLWLPGDAIGAPRTRPTDVQRWVNGADSEDFVALQVELTDQTFADIAKSTLNDRSAPTGSQSNRHRPVPRRKCAPAQLSIAIGRHQVSAQVEEIGNGGVHARGALRLQHRLESPHAPIP
jgi:hypothetical protein